MKNESFKNAELIKENGYLAYSATRHDGSRTEIYLVQGKISKLIYLHVFMRDKYGREYHSQGNELEKVLSESVAKEYREILTDIWSKRLDILSTHK